MLKFFRMFIMVVFVVLGTASYAQETKVDVKPKQPQPMIETDQQDDVEQETMKPSEDMSDKDVSDDSQDEEES